MISAQFTLREAQLFRMLTTLFGEERVIPHLSLSMVLGAQELDADTRNWAAQQRCLLTIVGKDDEPRFVLDFAAIEGEVIDPSRIELHSRGAELLTKHGIFFFSMKDLQFQRLISSGPEFTLVHYFDEQFSKLGIDLELIGE